MNRRLPVYLRGSEPEALLLAAASPRDRLIYLIGLYCGLRVSEIVKRRVEDVDLVGRTLQVLLGKGSKDRNVPIPSALLPDLRRWIGHRRKGFLFPSPRCKGKPLSSRMVQYAIKQAASRAGIQRKVSPHKLRHTYATTLLQRGANIREVQQLLGHASVATTEIYTHVEDDRLKAAADRLNFKR